MEYERQRYTFVTDERRGSNVTWVAATEVAGQAERAAGEVLVEMDTMDMEGQMSKRAATFVVDLAKAFVESSACGRVEAGDVLWFRAENTMEHRHLVRSRRRAPPPSHGFQNDLHGDLHHFWRDVPLLEYSSPRLP